MEYCRRSLAWLRIDLVKSGRRVLVPAQLASALGRLPLPPQFYSGRLSFSGIGLYCQNGLQDRGDVMFMHRLHFAKQSSRPASQMHRSFCLVRFILELYVGTTTTTTTTTTSVGLLNVTQPRRGGQHLTGQYHHRRPIGRALLL